MTTPTMQTTTQKEEKKVPAYLRRIAAYNNPSTTSCSRRIHQPSRSSLPTLVRANPEGFSSREKSKKEKEDDERKAARRRNRVRCRVKPLHPMVKKLRTHNNPGNCDVEQYQILSNRLRPKKAVTMMAANMNRRPDDDAETESEDSDVNYSRDPRGG